MTLFSSHSIRSRFNTCDLESQKQGQQEAARTGRYGETSKNMHKTEKARLSHGKSLLCMTLVSSVIYRSASKLLYQNKNQGNHFLLKNIPSENNGPQKGLNITDADCYATRYKDLLEGFCQNTLSRCPHEALQTHYLDYGIAEGRTWGCDEKVSDKARKKPVTNDKNARVDSTCDEIELRGGRFIIDKAQKGGRKFQYEPPIDEVASKRTVCGPKVIVSGVMKCGTNTIGDLLLKHPRVTMKDCQDDSENNSKDCDHFHYQGSGSNLWEMHGFTHIYKKLSQDSLWKELYGQTLPDTGKGDTSGLISIDKSPSYFDAHIHHGVEYRIHETLPHAKVVVTLCNPSERLYSEYNHLLRTNGLDQFFIDRKVKVPQNFTEFVEYLTPTSDLRKEKPAAWRDLRNIYLGKGAYASNYEKWLAAVGAENLLLLNMNTPQKVNAKKIIEFVGDSVLPAEEYPWQDVDDSKVAFGNSAYAGRKSAWKDHGKAMKWLYEYYKPFNTQLSKALGESWPLEWSEK